MLNFGIDHQSNKRLSLEQWMQIVYIICVSILLQSKLAIAQESRWITIEPDSRIVSLGMPWDEVSGVVQKGLCFPERVIKEHTQPGNEPVGASNNTSIRERSAEISHNLGLSADATIKFKVFDAQGAAAFVQDSIENEYSLSFAHTTTVEGTPEGLSASLPQNTKNKDCRDGYVSAIIRGGSLRVILRVDFMSREDKQKIEAKLGGNFKGILNANMAATIMEEIKQSNASITISAFQVGGTPTMLNQIFGDSNGNDGYHTTSCVSGDTQQCRNTIKAALDYSKKFGEQFKEKGSLARANPIRIYIELTDQKNAQLSQDMRLIRIARESLNERIWQELRVHIAVSKLLYGKQSQMLSDNIRTQLKQIEMSHKENMQKLREASNACYNNLKISDSKSIKNCSEALSKPCTSINIESINLDLYYAFGGLFTEPYRQSKTENKCLDAKFDALPAIIDDTPVSVKTDLGIPMFYIRKTGESAIANTIYDDDRHLKMDRLYFCGRKVIMNNFAEGEQYEFGGFWSETEPNPITRNYSCNKDFMDIQILNGATHLCQKKLKLNEHPRYLFGGAYTYPLVATTDLAAPSSYQFQPNPLTKGLSCPKGFSSAFVTISQHKGKMYYKEREDSEGIFSRTLYPTKFAGVTVGVPLIYCFLDRGGQG